MQHKDFQVVFYKMNIETLPPQAALSKYIDFYYFIKAKEANFESLHYSFPHVVNVVSVYKNASCQFTADGISVRADDHSGPVAILQGKNQFPISVVLKGDIDRISICFRPLGLNQFMRGPISSAMKSPVNEFHSWNEQKDFDNCLKDCFESGDPQERIDVLERFLLSCLKPVGYPKIELAIELLADLESNYAIEAIVREVNVSPRTFSRNFRDVIGVSPIEYKRIIRFRHSIEEKLFGSQFRRLTDIGYNNNFYDQSYFGKIYKKLTGQNPGAFFRAVEKLGDDKLIFRFVKP